MKSIINHTKEFEFHFPLRKFHFLKLQVAWKTGFPQRLLGGGACEFSWTFRGLLPEYLFGF